MGAEEGLPPMPMLATPEENATGSFWLAAGLELYHVSNGRFQLRYTASAEYRTLTPASDGGVFCGLNDGRLAEIGFQGEPRTTDFGPVTFLSVLLTRSGDLWLASGQTGLARCHGRENGFRGLQVPSQT